MKNEQFAKWLDLTFDQVESDQTPPPVAVQEAERQALKLGAGDILSPATIDKRSALAYLGKLLAWCREKIGDAILWDAKEAAGQLSLSPRTLWTLSNSGQIPCRRIGKLVRYSPAAIRDWAQAT